MQFGPLTQPGGERRLNVLVTRAREKVILVTSLQPEDLSRSLGSERTGLRLLQAYLRYARDKVLPADAAVKEDKTVRAYESDFEAAVADTLRSWGYEVEPQYGIGPYRIDLVVRDPLDPERVQVAVECDGATYHSLPTVRERDRIRQEWLERQGWKVVRVWSTEWWYQRRRAEERLRKEVEEALRKARTEKRSHSRFEYLLLSRDDSGSNTFNPTPIQPVPDLRARLLKEGKVEIYKRSLEKSSYEYMGKPRIADPEDPGSIRRLDQIDINELEQLLRISAEVMAPCKVDDLLREVATLLGFRRLGKRIRARLQDALHRLRTKKILEVDLQGNLQML